LTLRFWETWPELLEGLFGRHVVAGHDDALGLPDHVARLDGRAQVVHEPVLVGSQQRVRDGDGQSPLC